MKAYLDNNIISAIAKDDEPAESDALDRLLTAWRKGKVDLVTSELTLAEIRRYQDTRMRAAIERIFRLLEKVEIVRWDELVGIHSYGDARTWINTPLIENRPEYGALLKLELKDTDAQHVYVAGKQACDTFLTCDKGILRCAAGIKNIFPSLTVHKPSQFSWSRISARGWAAVRQEHRPPSSSEAQKNSALGCSLTSSSRHSLQVPPSPLWPRRRLCSAGAYGKPCKRRHLKIKQIQS